SHNHPLDRDPSATVSTNVGEEMQRGALLLAADGALSPSFAPVTLSATRLCEPAAHNTPQRTCRCRATSRPTARRRSLRGSCSMPCTGKNLSAPWKFRSMSKSRWQSAAEALVIAALSASAAAESPQAPIGTPPDLEAALLACWVPPPMEQSRPGMQ